MERIHIRCENRYIIPSGKGNPKRLPFPELRRAGLIRRPRSAGAPI